MHCSRHLGPRVVRAAGPAGSRSPALCQHRCRRGEFGGWSSPRGLCLMKRPSSLQEASEGPLKIMCGAKPWCGGRRGGHCLGGALGAGGKRSGIPGGSWAPVGEHPNRGAVACPGERWGWGVCELVFSGVTEQANWLVVRLSGRRAPQSPPKQMG